MHMYVLAIVIVTAQDLRETTLSQEQAGPRSQTFV